MMLLALVPFVLPLITALSFVGLGQRWRTRTMARGAILLLLVSAGCALAPFWNGPAQTPAWLWLTLDTPLLFQLDWTQGRGLGAAALLLLAALWIGVYSLRIPPTVTGGSLILGGLLLLVSGCSLVIGALTPLLAVLGVGLAGLGSLLVQLATLPTNAETTMSGLGPWIGGATLLACAAVLDPSLASTGPLWLLGCGLLLALAPARFDRSQVPLLLRAAQLSLGLPIIGGWLLVRAVTGTPGLWSLQALWVLTGAGIALLVSGVLATLTAQRLSRAVAGQWTAQLGLVLIALGQDGPALALLIHAAWTTALLAIACATLERAAGTEVLADLEPFAQPLHRTALIYGLAMASSLGLPLLAGYPLHRELIAAVPAWIAALIVASSSLLALGLIPGLAACIRRPAWRGRSADERGNGPALLALLALIGGAQWPVIRPLLLGTPPQSWALMLARSTAQLGLSLMLLGLITRRLRRLPSPPVFIGGEALDGEPGWALPWSAIRTSLLPPRLLNLITRSKGWLPRVQAAWQPLQPVLRQVSRRYYLSVIVALVLGILVVVASGGSR